MYIQDFGLHVNGWVYKNDKMIDLNGPPEEFNFSILENDRYGLTITHHGKAICRMRESTQGNLWLENIAPLQSSTKSSSADLKAHGKRKIDRVRAMKEKINLAIENLEKTRLVLDCMEKDIG